METNPLKNWHSFFTSPAEFPQVQGTFNVQENTKGIFKEQHLPSSTACLQGQNKK